MTPQAPSRVRRSVFHDVCVKGFTEMAASVLSSIQSSGDSTLSGCALLKMPAGSMHQLHKLGSLVPWLRCESTWLDHGREVADPRL